MTPKDGWFQVDDVTIHYLDWPGAGRPVLCIHGLTANGRYWDALAERLSPQYRVIAVDLRGRGQSSKPGPGSYGLSRHVADLAALLQHLNTGPAVVVGHSLGAYIGGMLAARHPDLVSHLALIDGGGMGEGQSEESIRAQIKTALARLTMTFPSFAAYCDYWRQMPFTQPWAEHFERYLRADVEDRPDGSVACRTAATAVEEDIVQAVQYDMHAVLPAVRAPGIVLWAPVGLIDPAVPLMPRSNMEAAAALLARGGFVVIDGANHYSVVLAPACLDQAMAALAQLVQEESA